MKTQVQTAQSQEKFVIRIDKNLAKIINCDTRKKLTDAYLKLFSGFAWINWTNKKSLGQSWHNALGQCDGFIKSKNPANPVTRFMGRVHAAHKKYWSKVIMTNQNSQNTLDRPEFEAKQMRAYGIKQIREAMGIINLIYEQFKQYEIALSAEQTVAKESDTKQKTNNTPQQQVQKSVAQAQRAQTQEQAMPAVQKNVVQQQPQAQAIAKPQQVKQPAVQMPQIQAAAKAQEQVKPQQVPKPVQWQQAQATAKAQEQAKPQQAKQPVVQIAQAKQPVTKVPEQAKPVHVKQPEQKIMALKPGAGTQIKHQQIRMFMFAKYNQRTA